MKRILASTLFLLTLIAVLSINNTVYAAPDAYIDPNTGGMLFQMLAVIFTMLSGFILLFSSRIKMSFARMMRFVREKTGRAVSQDATQENSIQ